MENIQDNAARLLMQWQAGDTCVRSEGVIILDEIFDTFDEDMKWTGTATRQEVHRSGLWHQTFHCWVLHRDTEGDFLVLQRRHYSKDTHPNKLDISCAGHLEAGEGPSDGIRELREELGLEVECGQLRKIGIYKYSDTSSGVKDNEFCHVFVLVQEGKKLEKYRPAVGELSGLYLARVNDMQNLCRRNVDSIAIAGFEMDSDGHKFENTLTITLGDMIEYDISYYELLFANLL